MRDVLPPVVRFACLAGDADEGELFPAERAVIERAVPKRRAEFTTGRYLARIALGELGVPPGPLLPGPDRAPQWPAGIAGSITHCDGFRACAVARTEEIVTLGIDAEPNAPLPGGVAQIVSLTGEREQLARLARCCPGISWERLLFSAKESVFKAWYPLTRSWLDFTSCELRIDAGEGMDARAGGQAGEPRSGSFTGRLLVPGPPLPGGEYLRELPGRWAVREGIIRTAVCLPAA